MSEDATVRVLLVSDFFPPVLGGLENHVDGLAAHLAGGGDEVTVATLTPDARATHPAVAVRLLAPTLVTRLPHESPQRPFHPPLPDPLTRRRLQEVIDDVRPEVIHAHSWLMASLPRRTAAPLVVTAHDYGMVCAKRTLLRPDGSTCDHAGPRCVPCAAGTYGWAVAALLAPGTVAGRRLLRPEHVIAVSEAVRARLAPALHRDVQVIPNFLRTDLARTVWDPADVGLGARPYVMFAGDPDAHKGLDVLLGAWAQLRPHADLLVATTRPPRTALPNGVRVARVPSAAMRSAWSQAAIAVVPSRWQDPSPTVVLEAMAEGIPVVASAVGGIPDMLRDGRGGLLVRPNDQSALGAAVGELLADDRRRRQLGAAGRARAAQLTDVAVVPQIRAAYDHAIASAAARSKLASAK